MVNNKQLNRKLKQAKWLSSNLEDCNENELNNVILDFVEEIKQEKQRCNNIRRNEYLHNLKQTQENHFLTLFNTCEKGKFHKGNFSYFLDDWIMDITVALS